MGVDIPYVRLQVIVLDAFSHTKGEIAWHIQLREAKSQNNYFEVPE